MKPSSLRLLLTHAAALLAGVLLVAAIPRLADFFNPAAAAAHETGQPATSTASSVDASSSRVATRAAAASAAPNTAEDFRQAWDLLMKQSLKASDRYAIERKLLTDWGETDPAAAIRYVADHHSVDPYLLNTVFARHPLECWKALSPGVPGLRGDALRSAWLETVSRADSSLSLSLLGEMPAWMQNEAVPHLFNNNPDPAFRTRLQERLQNIGATPAQLAKWQEQFQKPADAGE